MLLSLDAGVYLITGDLCIFSIDMKLPDEALETNQHMTLLDGVMVFNHHFQKMCFMVMDVVASSGKKCAGPLSQRFLDIRLFKSLDMLTEKRDIIQPLRKKYPPGVDETALPFLVLGQDYVKFKQFKSFLNKIERFEDEQGARYIYHNRSRYHDTNGLLFVPENGCWGPWENRQIKCWTWPDLDLVKFLVRFDEEAEVGTPAIVAYVTGLNDELMRYRTLDLPANHMDIISEALSATPEGVVISCSFDSDCGMWIFSRLSDAPPIHLIDLTAYLERTAANVTRLQLEATSSNVQLSPSNSQPSLHTSSNALTPTGTTPSSLTPNVHTPSSMTPSHTYTPTPATPYTPSPRTTGPSPAYGEEIYDTPPDKTNTGGSRTGGRTGQLASGLSARAMTTTTTRKRGSEVLSTSGSDYPPKKYKQ